MKHILGSHTIDTGGIDMAVRRAAGAGLRAVQIFTAIPKYYGDKSTIRADRVERFKQALDETGMRAEHVMVHAAYVLNLAIADERWARARDGIAKELERSTMLGVGGVCFHPGSASDSEAAGIQRIAKALTEALDAVDSDVKLYVENTAGGGRTIGRNPDEVAGILENIPDRHQKRIGYGLDTCHLYSSGYDVSESKEKLTSIIDEFEKATGRKPSFFHLNDSEGPLGSNRDRHKLLGDGLIGAEPFGWLLSDPRSNGVPLILETPQQITELEREDPTPDPYDIRMVALLEELAKKA
ncbi:MAG TPA: deoxyribonuclease IV [Longimicrobiales bacterium]